MFVTIQTWELYVSTWRAWLSELWLAYILECALLIEGMGRSAHADVKKLQDLLLRDKGKHGIIYTT